MQSGSRSEAIVPGPNNDMEVTRMKKLMIAALVVVALSVFSMSVVYAGGGKVRGENGQGGVNQVQVQDPPPFQP